MQSLETKILTLFFVRRYDTILNNLQDMGIARVNDIYLAKQMNFWKNKNKFVPELKRDFSSENQSSSEKENTDALDIRNELNENDN